MHTHTYSHTFYIHNSVYGSSGLMSPNIFPFFSFVRLTTHERSSWCLSASLYFYVYLSIYLSVNLSIYRSICTDKTYRGRDDVLPGVYTRVLVSPACTSANERGVSLLSFCWSIRWGCLYEDCLYIVYSFSSLSFLRGIVRQASVRDGGCSCLRITSSAERDTWLCMERREEFILLICWSFLMKEKEM